MSVIGSAKLLEMTNRKFLEDGSVLVKIERFSNKGVDRKVLKDGQEIAKIIGRLNSADQAMSRIGSQWNRAL